MDESDTRNAPWRPDWSDTATGVLRTAAQLAASLDEVREEMGRLLARVRPTPGSAAGGPSRVGRRGVLAGLSRLVQPAPGNDRREDAVGHSPIYAIGDIHGCYGLLIELIGKIGADAATLQGAGRPILVFCGDYVDRGEESARVLEALTCLRTWGGWDFRLLKGNHEQGLLRFLDEPTGGEPWLRFGGAATLRAYGVEPPAPHAPLTAWVEARDTLLRRMPASHLRLLQGLELMAVIGDHAFVHAGVAPGTPLAKQAESDLLWIRDEFLGAREPFEKVIVHGHSWIDDQPVIEKHRIGLDTGAYATGVLTAARLWDGRTQVIQARDPSQAPWPRSERRADGRARLVQQPADYSAPVTGTGLRVSGAPAAVTRPTPAPSELTGMDLRFHRV